MACNLRLLQSDWLAQDLELEPRKPGRSAQTYFSFPSPAHFRMRMRIHGWLARLLRAVAKTSSMALLRYFFALFAKEICLPHREGGKKANAGVMQAQKEAETGASGKVRGKYNECTAEERAQIGKYAAEHGPAKAVRHCSKLFGRQVPETTARRLKFKYTCSNQIACHLSYQTSQGAAHRDWAHSTTLLTQGHQGSTEKEGSHDLRNVPA